jgi:hypothetical protein
MNLSDIFSGKITDAKWRALGEYLQGGSISAGPGLRTRRVGNKTVISATRRAGGGGVIASPCPFGQIISVDDETAFTAGINGGVIHCGDQNWEMSYQGVNLAVSGVWLVYIEVAVEVNRDDDEELLLPGVKTGTRPTGDWGKTPWTDPTDYPANTAPVASTGLGTVILPIGKLTVAAGVARLENTSCGHFTVTHCAGTLGYTRE